MRRRVRSLRLRAWQCACVRARFWRLLQTLIKPTALLSACSYNSFPFSSLPRAQPTLSSLRSVGTSTAGSYSSMATRALRRRAHCPASSAVFGVTASSSPW